MASIRSFPEQADILPETGSHEYLEVFFGYHQAQSKGLLCLDKSLDQDLLFELWWQGVDAFVLMFC